VVLGAFACDMTESGIEVNIQTAISASVFDRADEPRSHADVAIESLMNATKSADVFLLNR
jgi:hypothetical protein